MIYSNSEERTTTWPNWIDLVVLILAFRGCYAGFCRGWLTEALHLAGMVGATAMSCHLSGKIVQWATPWWRGDPQLLDVVGFGVLWLVTTSAAYLIVRKGTALLTRERVHWISRGIGMIVGGVRGLCWAGVMLLFVLSWNRPYLTSSMTERSLLGPHLVDVSRAGIRWVVDRAPGRTVRVKPPLL